MISSLPSNMCASLNLSMPFLEIPLGKSCVASSRNRNDRGWTYLKLKRKLTGDILRWIYRTLWPLMCIPTLKCRVEFERIPRGRRYRKLQVYIDLSGWSPKYFPPQLVQYANTLLKHKVLFGSDYPLITPVRWLADFEQIAIKPEVRTLILKENAVKLLRLDTQR